MDLHFSPFDCSRSSGERGMMDEGKLVVGDFSLSRRRSIASSFSLFHFEIGFGGI